MSISAVIVTYNPEQNRFIKVFNSVVEQVNSIVIVDNNSGNKELIKKLCDNVDKCVFVEIGFNSGVAHALKVGINYAINYFDCRWILLLDDDTILLEGAIDKVFKIYESLSNLLKNRIGLIALTSADGDCKIEEITYGIFSGSIVKSEIAAKTCCRHNFFLDQADFDFYAEIRKLGYLTLLIKCKLMDHKLGTLIWIPVISNIARKPLPYEPPWRFYYMVRNSTILLKEGKKDFCFYISQILGWGIKILFRNGFKKTIKPLGLGILHALLNREGFLDPAIFK